MKIKKIISLCFIFSVSATLLAQNYPVTLRVVDKTFGVRTSNDIGQDEKNIVAGLSEELKFQGQGGGKWYYPLFKMPGTTGEVVKNDTAWIWQATIQAPVGEHSWRPCMKSAGYNSLNKVVAYYGEKDELTFNVDASGKVNGTTEITIRDEKYPVVLKVIDKSKGKKTNAGAFSEENIYLVGGKPNEPANARTNLQNEFVLHNAIPNFSDDKFDFSSGVNIGVWLSQTSNRGGSAINYFKKTDLKKLADMGYDHIRLPVDEKEVFDTDLNFNPETRQLIHDAIAWCKEYNMRIILDMHITRSHYFNDDKNSIILWKEQAEQDKLVNIWDKLSQEFGHYPIGLLAYELLNEANAPNADVWNNLSARIIAKIREREPDRYLIVGGISHNSASALSTLTLPENDKKLILAFHFYSPHLLTHYQASWMDGLKDLVIPLHYPAQLVVKKDVDAIKNEKHKSVVNYYNGFYNKSILKQQMQVAINRATELGLKLYCSEYGCISNTNKEVKQRWIHDVAEIFRENDIAFSIWGWKANFGILDNSGNIRDQRVIDETTRGRGTKFNLFPSTGHVIEKNDTAWIWSAEIEARTGCYSWTPCAYSTEKSINESIYQYDTSEANGALQFAVGLDGTVSGNTTLIIPDGGSATSLVNVKYPEEIRVSPVIFSKFVSIKGGQNNIKMYTLSGIKILEKETCFDIDINTSHLAKGFYVLVVDDKYSYKLSKVAE